MILFETKQELFDAVAKHLLTQKEKAFGIPKFTLSGEEFNGDEMSCAYENEEGLKCAIGGVMSPGQLNLVRDISADVYNLRKGFPVVLPFRETLDCLAQDLQRLHDQTHPSYWKEKLAKLAGAHNLSTEVLNQFE